MVEVSAIEQCNCWQQLNLKHHFSRLDVYSVHCWRHKANK